MATPASEVIDEARDWHPSFDPKVIQDKMLWRVISRAERSILQLVLEEADEVITVPDVIDLATISAALAADAGIALAANLLVSSGVVRIVDTVEKVPLNLLAPIHQHDPPAPWRPTAWIEGGDLVLLDLRRFGGTVTGWEQFDEITLQIVPAPVPIAANTSNLTVPDICRNAVVDALVLFMAARRSIQIAGVTPDSVQRGFMQAAASMRRQVQVGSWYVQRK